MTTRSSEVIDPARRAFLRGRLFTLKGRTEVRREQGLPVLAVLDRPGCLAWTGTVCMSCLEACPDQAIHLDQRTRPHIDTDTCSGCGDCIAVCPTDAITMR